MPIQRSAPSATASDVKMKHQAYAEQYQADGRNLCEPTGSDDVGSEIPKILVELGP
jgi:hypothetical protein